MVKFVLKLDKFVKFDAKSAILNDFFKLNVPVHLLDCRVIGHLFDVRGFFGEGNLDFIKIFMKSIKLMSKSLLNHHNRTISMKF